MTTINNIQRAAAHTRTHRATYAHGKPDRDMKKGASLPLAAAPNPNG